MILRNGWYLENHTSALGNAVVNGALIGSSNDGRFASASRADYAAAAVVVLTQPILGNKTYELAGDQSFSMTELASEVSRQLGRDIPYRAVLCRASRLLDTTLKIGKWTSFSLHYGPSI